MRHLMNQIFTTILDPRGDAVLMNWLQCNLTTLSDPSIQTTLTALIKQLFDFHSVRFSVNGSKGVYIFDNKDQMMIHFETMDPVCIQLIELACNIEDCFDKSGSLYVQGRSSYRHFKYDDLLKDVYVSYIERVITKLITIVFVNGVIANNEMGTCSMVLGVLRNVKIDFAIRLQNDDNSSEQKRLLRLAIEKIDSVYDSIVNESPKEMAREFISMRQALAENDLNHQMRVSL